MKSVSPPIPEWSGSIVHVCEDEVTKALVVIAIHSLRGDRAIGGTRIKVYDSPADAIIDAQRLAEGMTYKWGAVDIEAGGAKAVIALPERLDPSARDGLLRRYGELLPTLDERFATGPDLGTATDDMDIIATGAPRQVFGRTIAAGGAGDPAPFTARGVFEAMQLTAEYLWDTAALDGRQVVIQGLGHVGLKLARLLDETGCNVAFSDTGETASQTGFDEGLPSIPPERVYDEPCDIFAPCAVGGVIHAETIGRLRCTAVVGAANNQLGEAQDAERLRDRGILYAPDFIANCGGAIALPRIELDGWSPGQTMAAIVETVHNNLRRVYAEAESTGRSTDQVARRLFGNG